jgi:hypothetical protein
VDSVVSRRPPSPLQRLNGVGGQGAADEMQDGQAGPGTQEGKGYLFIKVPLHARRSQAGTRREMSLFGVAAFLSGTDPLRSHCLRNTRCGGQRKALDLCRGQ